MSGLPSASVRFFFFDWCRAWVSRAVRSEYLIFWIVTLYLTALGPFVPGFVSAENFGNVLIAALPLFLVALGQMVVLITGGIDLSVTSIIALASVLGAMVMNGDDGWLAGSALAAPGAVIVMLAAGVLVGLFTGTAITRFRMPPFIVTLTAMTFVGGLAIWFTRSRNIGHLPDSFVVPAGSTWLGLALAAALGTLVHLYLTRSLFGRWLYAVGHNVRAATISGVPVRGVIAGAYVVSGACAALAAILYTGQAETGSPVLGQRLLLDVIGATVLGGTSLFGGRGKVLWTLGGVLFLKLVDNSLNLLNLSLFAITMVKGTVILLAALLDAARLRLAGGRT